MREILSEKGHLKITVIKEKLKCVFNWSFISCKDFLTILAIEKVILPVSHKGP